VRKNIIGSLLTIILVTIVFIFIGCPNEGTLYGPKTGSGTGIGGSEQDTIKKLDEPFQRLGEDL